MDEFSPLQGGANAQKPQPSMFHAQSLAVLVMSPWLTFFTIMVLFTFVYSESPTVVWLWVVICSGMSLLLLALPNKRPEGPMFYMQLGVLCLMATCLGTMLGFYNWDRHMVWDAAYNGQRFYSNVLPTEPALSHLDAGKISFSSDSKVNTGKAMAYDDDSIYCVAPVMDSRNQSGTKAEYFAAGVDCCEASGSSYRFTCDAYDDAKAHSGLVYLKYGDSDKLGKFRKAAEKFGTTYGVAVSQDAIFVKWVRDLDRAGNAYQNSGVSFFLGTSLVYLVMCTAAGFMIHFSQRRGNRSRITKTSI
jgi:hypothetical protein